MIAQNVMVMRVDGRDNDSLVCRECGAEIVEVELGDMLDVLLRMTEAHTCEAVQ